MKCPADGATLLISERQGVEIDYCPDCRGVWLDRGELDKLLSAAERDDEGDDRDDRFRDRDADRRHEGDRPRKKKRSFLSEMFEFGGD